MRLTVGVVLILCLAEIFAGFWVGFVWNFRKFHFEFTKGFMCCLAWIFACFSGISVGIFRRFHWEFSKGFMCVVWLGFLLFFFWGSIGFEIDFYW